MSWDEFRLQKRLNLPPHTVEAVYADIAEIDSVKNSWHLSRKLAPQTVTRLTHSVIVTSTGASNRIEGNQLTDEEIEALYKGSRIKKFKTRDEQEVGGYLQCLGLVFENYPNMVVSESNILVLHSKMLAYGEKDARHRGQYKFGSNRVEAKDDSEIWLVLFLIRHHPT